MLGDKFRKIKKPKKETKYLVKVELSPNSKYLIYPEKENILTPNDVEIISKGFSEFFSEPNKKFIFCSIPLRVIEFRRSSNGKN